MAALCFVVFTGGVNYASACTGIMLTAKDGSKVIGRTMEWGGSLMESHVIVFPRGYERQAMTPTGLNGMLLKAKYGYVGIAETEADILIEGVNEKGLVGELFYFPTYGGQMEYDPMLNAQTITDAQFLDWVLCNFATIDEMEKELDNLRFIAFGHGFESAHFSIADATGRHVAVEFYDNQFHVWENYVGVITNSPSFDWQVTNLNNYMNVFAGTQAPRQINQNLRLKSFGVGTAALGLPGDYTPPSRFVRAAFFAMTAKKLDTGFETTKQLFQMLNNFDIPIGTEFADEAEMPDMISATQWTSVVNIDARKLYYRTEWNPTVRCIDLNEINFDKVKFQTRPLDESTEYPVEMLKIK